jgi:hypothetical protein
MNWTLRMCALIGVASWNTQAAAGSIGHPVAARHQLAACMTKRMSASKTLSYNEATKVCKAQLRPPSPTLASSATATSPGGMSR